MYEDVFQTRVLDGWSYYCLPGLTELGIFHGFFTGKSPDTRSASDMERLCAALDCTRAVFLDQEHGDEVHVITGGENPHNGDGIVVIEKGVAAVIKTADCLPVIIADPAFPMAAVVHAGWRGTVKRIAAKAARVMINLGARSGSMTAMLGPSIGPCCYEVGNEVVDAFRDAGFSEKVFHEKGLSIHVDLRQANKEALLESGVAAIYDTDLCTLCTGGLFASYRGGDRTARQISFVSLTGSMYNVTSGT